MSFMDFVQTYFIQPIIHDTGYNIYNTTTYAIILALAIWGVYHVLRKSRIDIDRKFIGSLIPFIIFGSAFRVWTDAKIIESPFFVTPGSYIITASLVMISIFTGIWMQKRFKISYHKTVFASGTVLAIISLSALRITNVFALLVILGIFAAIALTTVLVSRRYDIPPLYRYAFLAHMVDASATFTAIHFYPHFYGEKHVLSAFFIETFGPWSFFLLKTIVIVPVLYLIAKSDDLEQDWKNLLLFSIITLGLAPGLRGIFRVMMGV